MKKMFTQIAVAAIGTIAATAAIADGMPRGGSIKDSVTAPACGSSAYNWNGAFAGVQIGSASSRSHIDNDSLLLNSRTVEDQGLTIGGVIGYNWQKCNTVFGIEAEFNWNDLDRSRSTSLLGLVNLYNARTTSDWYGAIKLRTGFAFDNLLLYLTGGIAFADIEHTGSSPALGPIPAGIVTHSNSETRYGWLIGAGTEYALTNRITWRSEFTYTRFEDVNFGLNVNAPINLTISNLNAQDDVWRLTTGINFKF